MTALTVVLTLGAVWSLTQLVVADKITSGIRDALVDRLRRRRHRVVFVAAGFAECRCGWSGGRKASDGLYETVDRDGHRTLERSDATLEGLVEDHEEFAPHVDPGKLAYLLTCPWCASFSVAVPVAATAQMWGDTGWWSVPALALTARVVAGVMVTRFGPHETEH